MLRRRFVSAPSLSSSSVMTTMRFASSSSVNQQQSSPQPPPPPPPPIYQNPQLTQLPPLLRHALSASSPDQQNQQVYAYQQGNYSSYPYYGQMPHEQQHSNSNNNDKTSHRNHSHNHQHNQNQQNVGSFVDRVHAERREFLERGYFAVKMNHVTFVACCFIVAMMVPDMFDNHLAESMRYNLLMRDTSLLEKKQIQHGFTGLKEVPVTAGNENKNKKEDGKKDDDDKKKK